MISVIWMSEDICGYSLDLIHRWDDFRGLEEFLKPTRNASQPTVELRTNKHTRLDREIAHSNRASLAARVQTLHFGPGFVEGVCFVKFPTSEYSLHRGRKIISSYQGQLALNQRQTVRTY
jgi:hypothetical protein